jgi:hypothetical protein
VDAGNKVVNVDQVVAVIGTTCSGATNAMVQSVTIPAGIASNSDSATVPSITELDDNNLVFRSARREVGSLTDHRVLSCDALSHQVTDRDRAGGQFHSRREPASIALD